jgi:hypothetical protein
MHLGSDGGDVVVDCMVFSCMIGIDVECQACTDRDMVARVVFVRVRLHDVNLSSCQHASMNGGACTVDAVAQIREGHAVATSTSEPSRTM